MRYLTRNQIVERAMKVYSIQEKDISRASAVKTIAKLAAEHPVDAEVKYADLAFKKGNEYYYPARVAFYLIVLGEPYFAKNSSDPIIRDIRAIRDCHELAKEAKARCSTPGDYFYNKRAIHEKNKEDILLHLEEKTGLTISKIEESCKDAIWYDQRDLKMLIDYANAELTDVKIPPIISDSMLEKFYHDTDMELIKEKYEDWSDVPFITGYQRRSLRPLEALEEKQRDYMLKAVFNLFFEPFDTNELYLDMNRLSDQNPEHHDEEYYITLEKMTNYKNYCILKDTPICNCFLDNDSFKEMKRVFAKEIVREITENAVDKLIEAAFKEIARQQKTMKIG